MYYEFEIQLINGRIVFVTGKAKVIFNCDCYSEAEMHPHIETQKIERVIDVFTGTDAVLSGDERVEIEQFADMEVYSLISDDRE